MKPIDYRNDTWESLQERLTALRLAALHAWREHGPGTTREVARRAGMDILTFRPRTTELHQLGYVVLQQGESEGRGTEGVYSALSDGEARALFIANQARHRSAPCQPELKLS